MVSTTDAFDIMLGQINVAIANLDGKNDPDGLLTDLLTRKSVCEQAIQSGRLRSDLSTVKVWPSLAAKVSGLSAEDKELILKGDSSEPVVKDSK